MKEDSLNIRERSRFFLYFRPDTYIEARANLFQTSTTHYQCACLSALVAQLAERTAVNREAIGSNPIRSVYIPV